MPKYTDEQKKKNVLAKLVMRGNVGGKYTPRKKVYSGIPKHERGNLESLLDELHKDGFIEYHKGKKCVSINRYKKDMVKEYLQEEVPEFYWDNW
ncbi:hypothetical protein AKJ51_03355 [candidate division MSBL1 archaeon SCGC-AAA382A20]|uniref:30S ribosomal protein S19e n=1 Tax=candidate division MSBL1 archaeon SCGC-AAA382A20 TaxID=1698280 RepID=A0A133VJK9_9EURY|nr:hypothetical protein AKJ51_03355 [candidate division MSBL1 archaeon SCGC-AAA382A20]